MTYSGNEPGADKFRKPATADAYLCRFASVEDFARIECLKLVSLHRDKFPVPEMAGDGSTRSVNSSGGRGNLWTG
jgi:hypothetical protein